MVALSPPQPEVVSAPGGLETQVVPGSCGVGFSDTPRHLLPHAPGRVPHHGTRTPPGVQPGAVPGAGQSDGRGGGNVVGARGSPVSVFPILENTKLTISSCIGLDDGGIQGVHYFPGRPKTQGGGDGGETPGPAEPGHRRDGQRALECPCVGPSLH